MKKVDFFSIFKNEGLLDKIIVYPGQETQATNYDSSSVTMLNPITIRGLVSSISFEALRWKYFGVLPSGSKQVIIEKRYKSLLMNAFKIKIGEEHYKCYKDDSKGFAIKESSEYVVAILEWKNV
jgi:hypothetical protein